MIIVKLQGGLGNQLFQFSFGRYLAFISDTELTLDSRFLSYNPPKPNFTNRTYDLDIFQLKDVKKIHNASFNYNRLVPKLIGEVYQTGFSFAKYLGSMYLFQTDIKFNKNIIQPVVNDVYLDGYWQSEKYFLKMQHDLRKELVFKDQLEGDAALVSNLIRQCESVCMHIRRGDYINSNNLKQHGLCDIEYYQNAQNLLNNKFLHLKYFIFSDDIAWCKNIFKGDNYFFIEDKYAGKKSEYHFQLMTLCKHFIIANSSFSWWAAWLASYSNKIIIAPSRWFSNPSSYSKDIIPSDWIKI